MAPQIQIQNLESFLASVREAQRRVSDLSAPLSDIARDWMRTNQVMFTQYGPGRWADLSAGKAGKDAKGHARSPSSGYKAQKLRRWGFIYPIGKASGAMERSLTDPTDGNAIFEIENGSTLRLGSRVTSKSGANYPVFFHRGTSRMPGRNLLTISDTSIARWKKILSRYVIAAAQGQTNQVRKVGSR